MSYHDIKATRIGLNITCHRQPRGLPIRHGTSVRFAHGVPGFEQVKTWVYTSQVDVRPFFYMNAGDDSVRFVCVETFRICPDYCLELPRAVAEPLAITPATNLALLSIVTVRDKPEKTTANLMSPIIVNLDSLRGEQVIGEESRYPLTYCIWEKLNLGSAEEEVEQLAAV